MKDFLFSCIFSVAEYLGSKLCIILPADSVTEEVKSVDILAALPTPPHNQNEDIRYNRTVVNQYTGFLLLNGYKWRDFFNRMESDDEDAPESIIPASSPESNVGDETPRFPHLREPKEEETERAISPIIPLIPRTTIPGIKPHSKCCSIILYK